MNKQTICIYEDAGYKGFGPLTDTRPVWELRCGAFTLAEKIVKLFASHKIVFHTRRDIKPVLIEEGLTIEEFNPPPDSGTWLFVNGCVLLSGSVVSELIAAEEDTLFISQDKPVAVRLSGENLRLIINAGDELFDYNSLSGLRRVEVEARVMEYPWHLVNCNSEKIGDDLDFVSTEDAGEKLQNDVMKNTCVGDVRVTGSVDIRPGVVIDAEEHQVRLETGVRLGPGVIIDASAGPVWIAEGSIIEAGAVLMGPVYIGSGSIVRRHARLHNGVCLGPHCRVGGEIGRTIMQGYSSKQHSGFLGTSYIGSWVNLGAATDNSDLKNTYKPVDVVIGGEKVNTGELHIGVYIGDFCRTAIQTRLNSGTVAGVCCNIIDGDFPLKNLPAFTWVGLSGYHEYRFNKAIETIRTMMPRRGKQLTPALETLLREIYNRYEDDRARILRRSR